MKNIHGKLNNRNQIWAIFMFIACLFAFSFTGKDDVKKEEMVVISTKFGDMTVRLYPETPLHKANFLKLVHESYFDSLLFHRVIKGFMIQGGDPDSRGAVKGTALGRGGPGYTIPAEFNSNYIHKKGALSAARQGDNVNPKKESSGSQFYIVQGKPVSSAQLKSIEARRQMKNPSDTVSYTPEQIKMYETIGGTPFLDGGYTVFGEVVEGLDVIDSIAAQPVGRADRPKEDIVMSMKIVKKKWPLPTKK